MALFRLYRKEWEKDLKTVSVPPQPSNRSKKRKAAELEDNAEALDTGADILKGKTKKISGNGRRGVSSGLSTIVIRRYTKTMPKSRILDTKSDSGSKWWKSLGTSESKGSIKVTAT